MLIRCKIIGMPLYNKCFCIPLSCSEFMIRTGGKVSGRCWIGRPNIWPTFPLAIFMPVPYEAQLMMLSKVLCFSVRESNPLPPRLAEAWTGESHEDKGKLFRLIYISCAKVGQMTGRPISSQPTFWCKSCFDVLAKIFLWLIKMFNSLESL